MPVRRPGRTNLQVSERGFGAARGYDEEGFPALVHAMLDAGINFIDTAAGYDDSEACPRARPAGAPRRHHRDEVLPLRQLPPRGELRGHSRGPQGLRRGEPAPLAARSPRHPARARHPDPRDLRPLHDRRVLRGDGAPARRGKGALHRHQRTLRGRRQPRGAPARGAHRSVRRRDADAELRPSDGRGERAAAYRRRCRGRRSRLSRWRCAWRLSSGCCGTWTRCRGGRSE